MGIESESVLKRVVAATVVGFLIVILFFYYAMCKQQSQELTAHIDANLEMLSKEISSNIVIRADWMRTTLQLFQDSMNADAIVLPFLQGDRQQLLHLASVFYQNLNQRNRITHMYFMDMQRSVVLRMHQPDRFGDVIGRLTAIDAEETGLVSSGVELGPLGTLTLRVVLPWVYQGNRIGYLEIGIELEEILQEIESDSPFSIILLVQKNLLSNTDWVDGQKILGRSNDWNLFDQYVAAYPTEGIGEKRDIITAYLNKSAGQPQTYVTELKGVIHGMSHLPFTDVSGDEIGQLIMLMDLSMENMGFSSWAYSMMTVLIVIMLFVVVLLGLIISRSEKARRHAESKLELASEAIANTVEGIMITDSNGTIINVNRAFESVTGYSRDEAIGNNPNMLKSGCQDQLFYEAMWKSISDTGAWHGRLVNRRKNGDLYPERLSITAIKDDDATVTNYIGIFSDVSEEELLEQQAHELNKVESLNTLVGGIAHEFNNMLAGMTGNLYLARSELDASSRVSERLMFVEKMAFNASDIIRRLLAYTSQDIVSKTIINILPVVSQAMDSLQEELPRQTQLNMYASDESFIVEVDQSQLLQILVNLITNATDAVKQVKNPEINVNVNRYIADEAFISRHPNVICMKMAKLSVSDNGCGISDKQMKYIFDPFYTTKDVGEGPGLGLSMAYGVMKSYGGAIEVESREGVGTSVHLYFPLHKQDQTNKELDDGEMVRGHGETILLVDDDILVLDTACRVLKKLGYRVMRASNGKEAVSCYREFRHDIDLVMMDVVMPVMGGVDAALAIRVINPKVKLIFATGFDVREKLKQQISISGDLVLNKPYNIKKLSYKLHELLNPNKQK